MKFSVLLSVYKKEKPEYFRQALDSVIKQTRIPDEVVVVQDGPLTTELDAVCDEYSSRFGDKFHFLVLENNVGLGKALQLGVLACQYEIIARMDTDDIAKPVRFEKQLQEFIHDPKLALLGASIEEFSTVPDAIDARRIVPCDAFEIAAFAKHRNPFNHMTVMFRKDAVVAVGNYLPMHLSEDYYLWFRLIRAGYKMRNLSDCLVSARVDRHMFERRGGFHYFLEEWKLQKIFYKEGFINFYDFVYNLSIRLFVRVIPTFLRRFLYRSLMRK